MLSSGVIEHDERDNGCISSASMKGHLTTEHLAASDGIEHADDVEDVEEIEADISDYSIAYNENSVLFENESNWRACLAAIDQGNFRLLASDPEIFLDELQEISSLQMCWTY